MDIVEFRRRYPVLYHMADEAAWPSIQRHGLLSTRALVDLFEPPPHLRWAILTEVRRLPIQIRRDGFDAVTIRDQLPLKFLDECLDDGVSRQDFLDALNGRVFFWLSDARLQRLLNAKGNRSYRHLVLTIDTAALLGAYGRHAELAPYNTGNAHVPPPHAPKRGPGVFVPLTEYPFDEWQRKRGRSGEHAVELTIPGAVPDIVEYVRRVELRQAGDPAVVVVDTSDRRDTWR